MALLYTSNFKMTGFRNAIAFSDPTFRTRSFHFIGHDIPLDGLEGAVLVGPQSDVFGTSENYFRFIDYMHENGLKIAAVLNLPQRLPDENAGIDHVIEFVYGTRKIYSVGQEIAQFFGQFR